MKVCVLVLLCIAFCAPIYGQNTTVSGTIVDSGAQPWIRGTISFSFKVSPSNPTAQYYLNGVPFSKTTNIQADLDGSGHFSSTVPSNTSITPAGSTWTIEVCSIARGNTPCYSTQSGMTITGATQDISSTVVPPAISIDLTHVAYPFVTAYTSSEITTATFGGLFYNFLQNHYFICEAISPSGIDQSYGACTQWKEICQVGDGLCGGAGTSESFQHNNTLVGQQPIFNIIDSGTVTATMTNDIANNRVNVSFAAASGTGCTVGALLDQWVVSIHPDHTCFGSTDWLWDDTNRNNRQGDGTNTLSGTNTLAFSQGKGNAQTNVSRSWAIGDTNTSTCDGSTLGAACRNFYSIGRANSITDTGASSSSVFNFLYGDGNAISVTGGATGSDLMQLLRSNTISGALGADVDDIVQAGTGNNAASSGANSVTSSAFQIGENDAISTSAGADLEDNFQLGENSSIQATAATSGGGFMTQIGFNHTFFTSTPGVQMNYGTAIGHANTNSDGSGATTNQTDFIMVGHSLHLVNCTDCFAFGKNIDQSTSNQVSLGMSATPEISITPGATTIGGTGTVNIAAWPVSKIISFTYCHSGGCDLDGGAGTPCLTGNSTNDSCVDTINFASLGTMPDSNYSPQCTGIGPIDAAHGPGQWGRVTLIGIDFGMTTTTVPVITATQGATHVAWTKIACTLVHR